MRVTEKACPITGGKKKVICIDFMPTEIKKIYEGDDLKPHIKEAQEMFNKRVKENNSFAFGSYKAADCIERIETGNSIFEQPASLTKLTKKARQQTVKRRKKYTEFEGEPQLERYLEGSETPFQTKTKRTSNQSINIDIYIHIGTSGGVNADLLAEYYSDAITEAYKYILQGRNVNVYAIDTGTEAYENGSSSIIRTCLKEAGKPVDFKRISCAMYPAFFRHYFFNALFFAPVKPASSFGRAIHDLKKIEKLCKTFPDYNDSKEVLLFDFKAWQDNGKTMPEIKGK